MSPILFIYSINCCTISLSNSDLISWRSLENVDLQNVLRKEVHTLKNVPGFFRASFRNALLFALVITSYTKSHNRWKPISR